MRTQENRFIQKARIRTYPTSLLAEVHWLQTKSFRLQVVRVLVWKVVVVYNIRRGVTLLGILLLAQVDELLALCLVILFWIIVVLCDIVNSSSSDYDWSE